MPLKNNMPPIPVRDLLIHPREKDLVVGTYGRGVWVTNTSPLQELNSEILGQDFYLFNIIDEHVNNSSPRARWGNYQMTGDAHIRTRNERSGLNLYYYLRNDLDDALSILVEDFDGQKIADLKTAKAAGIHKITWNSPDAEPGTFRFILTDGEKTITKKGTLKPEIYFPIGNPDDFR